MQIIPVMDISNGLVVHAINGERQNYKSIKSQICSSALPSDVVDGFLNIYDFKSIYIADLDALTKHNNQTDLIHSICRQYSEIIFWLDCGIDSVEQNIHAINVDNIRYILSSESILSLSTLTSILETHPNQDFILSLDFKEDKLLGSNDILSAEKHWPNKVIALNLNEVGENNGFVYPTFVKQSKIAERFKLHVGGGIRNIGDIAALSKQGVEGALISSALHSQAISTNDLKAFTQSL